MKVVIPLVLVLASLVLGTLGYNETNFTQLVDHFDTKINLTFQQTVLIDDSWWNGSNDRPIFVIFGGAIQLRNSFPLQSELINQLTQHYEALIIYIEHRFYGKSIPFGSIEKAIADERVRDCLTIEQSLEDFKTIILSLKSNISAHLSPVVVFGVEYSGALAAYFRIKYPHLTVGALASSAPMFLIGTSNPRNNYCPIVSQHFEDINRRCYQIIKDSWKKLDDIASQIGGMTHLSHLFKTCRPIQSVDAIKQKLSKLYSLAAQNNYPITNKSMIDPICDLINREKGSLNGVAKALTTSIGRLSSCFDNDIINLHSPFDRIGSNTSIAWDWQRCHEIIFPIGCGSGTMLPRQEFNLTEFELDCKSRFGVMPNSNFLHTYFGSNDIKEILRKNGSNIIFSNGLIDPFSGDGILENISESIVAVKTTEGTHQLDVRAGGSNDPAWLVEQRRQEFKIIQQWIDQQISQENNVRSENFNTSRFLNIYFWFHNVVVIIYALIKAYDCLFR